MSAAATVTSLIVRRKERHPEVTKMSLPESITTCLSPAVHYMVCKLGFEIKENYDINNFVSKRGEVSWRTISERVCYLESDQSIDYVKSVQLLGPVCESVHLHLRSLTTEQFEVQYALWFQWTNATELFLEVFGVLECMQVTAIALSLMKLTSCLERALGDVFLLIGKDCPFLLRDLLASQELAGVFGRSVMNVLRVFIGSPRGLNLRNILWHGFASPQEIPVKYCSMLLFLTAGLGQLLKRYLVQNKLSLVHRPYITFSNLEELDIFPDINYEVLSLTEELAKRSSFVLKIMLPFWISALTAFRQHRYADCITLLLPQLETGLRLLFTTVNKCPSRLLTAEVLECMKSISSWSELPVVSEEQIQAITGHERCTEMQELVSLITGILSQLQHHLPPSCYILDDPLNNLLTEELLTELCGMQIRTLYCPRLLLEVLVVLRQIGTQCHQVSEQVIVCTEMRYKQWVNKTLHSRQRHNYLRMLKSVKFLSPVLRLILVLITLELNNIHAICQENPFEYQQYLKFLKSILQYTENLVTYTSPEKNKWDETGQLTYRALIKMKTFNARKLTLMQLATQKKMS
ncbi:endoplasmic reticulum membrane-associated RNA degradation protein isoform X3 [Alligator sinensis]|uniref:Endoplasmic reticulum membrane-associated RNA degradation protein isoform X3 n=1 Tax=Alligator sinensis TaxID=38654 RepID=A0A3Q0FTR1_ALLSI|nr:endoplasmic reticulum membrane-associated RNA degradation protein isoform X3 [Alligator sinensis]